MGNSRFSDGFLIGALVGGVAVFLFATKKGNKVLKAISENGMDGLTDLIDNFEKNHQDVPRVVKKTEEIAKDIIEKVEDRISEDKIDIEAPKTNNHAKKRFFRKAK